jgi:hypothetical protein
MGRELTFFMRWRVDCCHFSGYSIRRGQRHVLVTISWNTIWLLRFLLNELGLAGLVPV